MIEVTITKNGEPLAHIQIVNSNNDLELADYNIKYAVERGSAVGTHVRNIHNFPRKKYNVLALLRQALMTLDQKELLLERDFDPDEAPVSSNLARRLRRALR